MKHKEMIELIRSGKLSRRQMISVMASVGVGVTASSMMPRGAAANSVNLKLLEWNGYESPQFHPEYAAKYGGEPKSTFFAETEDAYQKMRAGFKVDLVHPCTGEVAQFKDAGLIKPIETDRIERWGDIIPALLEVKGVRIDGQFWFAPWDWGYSTVGFNPETMHEDNPTFDMFINPKYKGKTSLTSQIGVNILIAGVIGKWAKPLDPTEAEMEMAPEIFTKMLENARFIWTDSTQLEQAWVAGDVGMSYIYGSATKRMQEQGIPVQVVDPVMPWMCGFCVSSNADGSEDQAYDYINANLDPEAGAVFTKEYGYGHANKNSVKYGDAAYLKEKGLDDPVALLAKGVFFDEVPPAKNEKLFAMWHEAQAGLD